MLTSRHPRWAALALAAGLLAAGCGSGSSSSSSSSSASPASAAAAGSSSTSAASAPASSSQGSAPAGALSADARSKTTGDIPDNQVFLTYAGGRSGFSMRYPEGWTQSGSARNLTFKDKNNVVHVVVATGAPPTPASVAGQLRALARARPSLRFSAPQTLALGSGPAIKSTYTTRSAPNPVTGKSVTLIVDRYELASRGRTAVVDLGTPQGVDNVDAYKLMIRSFRWR